MATIVYIDSMNFFYGAVKGTPHKWLDYEALCRRLIPRDRIERIRFFTSPIKATAADPGGPERQQALLRATAVNPLIEIHLGHFRADLRWLPVAPVPWSDVTRPRVRPRHRVDLIQRRIEPRLSRPPIVRVLKTEEKGSDVNLASHLVRDVFKESCTKALVISNDSDLAEPIALAVAEGVPVGVVNPHRRNRMSGHLEKVASFEIQLHHPVLVDCHLPNPVVGPRGRQIHKPKGW